MEKPKRRRGISLSHQSTPAHNGEDMDESRVRQIARPLTQGPSTPLTRLSSAPKPRINFSYAHNSATHSHALSSAHSNSAFSQASSARPSSLLPSQSPLPASNQFAILQQPRMVVQRRLFGRRDEREALAEASTQTERKNYLINTQFDLSQGRQEQQGQQGLPRAYVRDEYQKLRENRRKELGINKVYSLAQEPPKCKQEEAFARVQLEKGVRGKRLAKEDLQSLQEMEKRLKDIINICDGRSS